VKVSTPLLVEDESSNESYQLVRLLPIDASTLSM